MADLIDSDSQEELTGGDSAVAFNIPDLKALAAKILRRANDVANQKIEQAKEAIAQSEAEAKKVGEEKGYAEGLAKGEAEGRAAGDKAAREEFAGKVGPVLAAMQSLLQDLAARKTELQAKAEADMLRLGMEVARRIVRREIEVDDDFVVPIVREAVALTNNRSDLVVRMHPDDEKAIMEELPNLHAIFSDLGRVQVEPDKGVDRGGVVVQTRQSEVDMKLWRQFEALERALVGDTAGIQLDLEQAQRGNEKIEYRDDDEPLTPVLETEQEASFEEVEKVLQDRESKAEHVASETTPTSDKAVDEQNDIAASIPDADAQLVEEQPDSLKSEQPVEQSKTQAPDKPDTPVKDNSVAALAENGPVLETGGVTEPQEETAPLAEHPEDFKPMQTADVPDNSQLVADEKTIEQVKESTPQPPVESPDANSAPSKTTDVLGGIQSIAQLPKNPQMENLIEQSVRMHLGNGRR